MTATDDEDGRYGSRSPAADVLAVFAALWALATVWHLLGNPTLLPGWLQALLVLAAGAVLVRPGAVLPLAALAAVQLASAWAEAPLLGNHWLLVGLVDVALLVGVGVAVVRRQVSDRAELANRFFPAARLCLLGFYAFAAFAKLNTAFFDRSVSCAVHYLRETTTSLGLDALPVGNPSVQRVAIVATAAVELAIPVLLAVRRTRHVGVVVGLAFHAVVALDRTHQFFDFSSVLYALFLLFLPLSAGPWVAERLGSVRARLALRRPGLPAAVHLLAVGAVVLVGAGIVLDRYDHDEARALGWWPWQLLAVTAVVATVRFLRQERPAPVRGLVPHHPLYLLVPLVVVLNGLTPYLELKTGYGWNMYANLRTVDGETNHLLLPATLPLTDEQADVVRIVATDDPGLDAYRRAGYGLTWRQFRTYVDQRPDLAVTYERAGVVTVLRRAEALDTDLGPLPAWREKLQLFRAVDLTSPERCLPSFGPAR